MSEYEMIYILKANQTDQQWEASRKYVNDYITQNEGSIQKEDVWGLRPIASEIDGQRQGYFVLLYFSVPTNKIAEFKFQLNIHETMLRFMLTKRIPDPTPKAALANKG